MVIQRGKVIDMLKQMAKADEIPVDVQLIITQRLLENSNQLKPDKEELEVALYLHGDTQIAPQGSN